MEEEQPTGDSDLQPGQDAETFDVMRCRQCGRVVSPNRDIVRFLQAQGRGMSATSRDSCIYRCSCGVAYSNATDETKRVMILDRPEDNVPAEVRGDLESVLAGAVNEFNQKNKRDKFCYETSEDAVVWTIFMGLAQLGRLDAAVAPDPTQGEPRLLLWGAPADGERSGRVAQVLEQVSRALGESHDRRSEPDVTLV
jgi:hypothetical protein